MVGKCLHLRDFSWQSFWYVILATRGLWKASGVKNLPRPSSNGEKSPIFWRSFSISRPSRPRTWAYGASPKSLVHKLQLRLLFGSSCYTKNFLREQNVKNVKNHSINQAIFEALAGRGSRAPGELILRGSTRLVQTSIWGPSR